MGKQTQRRGYRAARQRKYVARRIFVLLVLFAVIGGLTWLLTGLLSGSVPGAAKPTPSPEGDVTGSPTSSPAPTETPQLPDALRVTPMDETALSALGFTSGIMFDGEDVSSFLREDTISFPRFDQYTALKGVIAFGGNNYRNSFTYGTQTVSSKTLARVWEADTGALDCGEDGTWTGTGWTGMPIVIQWEDDVRPLLGVYDEYKTKAGFTEVIYPTMDGHIYFYELSSGEKTRDPIDLGVVTKGTAALDPRGYPLLYTGQGIQSENTEGKSGAWFRVISLIENKTIWSFGGKDPFSYRIWQAYDSSPLIAADADTLITGGENGVLYSVKLNAAFDKASGTVSVSPGPLAKYRYTASNYGEADTQRWWGIENSVAAWRNYVFFTDNGGLLQCVDVNTLETQYAVDLKDDSDASLVIEEDPENNTFYLYTANEVDKQPGTESGYGKSWHRKIDGLTGRILWENAWDASVGGASSNGGTLATPHVGRGNISDLVIYSMTLVPVEVNGAQRNGGRIVAYDKKTGAEVWRYEQGAGYWSSPVVIYDEQGDAYILQCDRDGMLRMHDTRTGEELCSLDLGSRVESTPAVFGNLLVVGTRGQAGSGETQKIICVRIG
ncbi:MAG TPA: PQQ-binding-like beta-propeller repeat protein [Clostridia bacterium]|nr:PQQ-binding-like beta-propeller repeat protein [Clostridia bacterium]